MTTTEMPDESLKALRAEIIGDYRPFGELARAMDCAVRSVYNFVARLGVKVIKINNVPHAQPTDFRRALLKEHDPPAPRRGRPRRSAQQLLTAE
jgi:hypothetical protein